MKKLLLVPVIIIALACFSTSCRTYHNVNYMQGKFDTAKLSRIVIPEPVIQNGDLVSIVVYSDNPAATAIYNQSLIITAGAGTGNAAASLGAAPTAPGYLVDEQGNIELQQIGLFHVSGMTKKQLTDSIVNYFVTHNLLTNPYCNIRILNYKISLLGEVNKPGTYSIPGDHVTILEALGLGGDVTIYGRRDSVLVIREINGKRQFSRLDLRTPDLLASPFYYLQQNDMVIVEQTQKKAKEQDAQRTARAVSLAATVVSALAIIYSIFRR
jgi:polysaccharide export outer membrane protein